MHLCRHRNEDREGDKDHFLCLCWLVLAVSNTLLCFVLLSLLFQFRHLAQHAIPDL